MGTTPNRGYTYPDSSSNANLWTHFQTLATGIDTDMDAVWDRFAAMVPKQVDNSDNNASPLATTGTPALGSTTCSVNFTAPPSGRAFISLYVLFQKAAGTGQLYMGPQVREGSSASSGTVFFNPTNDPGAKVGGDSLNVIGGSCTRLLEGMTPGGAYNVAATYFNIGGSGVTISYYSRAIQVVPTF